ncbi:MAG: radical SAM family heme chaperone HemW [Oligoflexia bacterium]|jgi:putative oxygen-independent coproporphyrinogen III oxidase
MKLASLYLHFPFCETKCHYCDFYSIGRERTAEGDAPLFERALRSEIELQGHRLAPHLDTIFMGGGTPSMTPPDSMARTLEPLWTFTSVTPETEWTMEANPSSVDEERLRQYRALGVNRISMGVQALRDDLLLRLGRVHSRDKALQALESIFAAGMTNVSVDLLCGVPGQSVEDVERAIEELTRFPITHLSCYLLTLPKSHRMHRELPDEDGQLEHLLAIDRLMQAKGFDHYEISNFARRSADQDYRARHNLNYWKRQGYLGLGPSAHSFDPSQGSHGARWKNISALHRYAEVRPPVEWTEELTEKEARLEDWMLALRLSDGFPGGWLEKPEQRQKARLLEKEGLLEPHPQLSGRLRLTARGFAVSDQVIAALAS